MKDQKFNFYHGLLLLFIYFKFTQLGPNPQGPPISWWDIVWAVVIITVWAVVEAVGKMLGWDARLKFWFWKVALKYKVRQAGKKTREEMAKWQGKGRTNPGAYVDPTKAGKRDII